MKSQLLIVALVSLLAGPVSSQTPKEQVRVRTKHANVQAGPTSGADVLVLVPRGTILTVIERRGPWVTVELTPDLRNSATPMRWYKDERRGFIHDSQLEPGSPKPVK